MFGVNFFSFRTQPVRPGEVQDSENSTFLKVLTCVPFIGLFVAIVQKESLKQKLIKIPLPKNLRPHPILGKQLDENASLEKKKAVCQRAIQLMTVDRDYTKAMLVNNLLTIALSIYLLALNIIPVVIPAILIGGFTLTSAIFVFILCGDSSIKRYREYAKNL